MKKISYKTNTCFGYFLVLKGETGRQNLLSECFSLKHSNITEEQHDLDVSHILEMLNCYLIQSYV